MFKRWLPKRSSPPRRPLYQVQEKRPKLRPMTEYYKIHNSNHDVIARIEGREFAHKVAEVADKLRPEDSPHSVQQ